MLIESLSIAMSIDGAGVSRDVSGMIRDLDLFEREAERVGVEVERAFQGIQAPDLAASVAGSGGASAAARSAEDIGAAMSNALVPLLGFAARFEKSFDRVGGTIVQSARRTDAAMKFPLFDATLAKLEETIPNAFGRAAVSSVRKLAKIQDYLGHFGDVAGKGLNRLGLGAGGGGLGNFAAQISGIAPAAAGVGSAVDATKAKILGLVGATTIAGGATAFLAKGIAAASDLNETLSKTDQVFGPASAAVKAQADGMAKAFGLSRGELLDGATAIGLMGKAAGQNEGQAAAFGNAMVKLAADASSFHNVPVSEALDKIRSGLAGEAEPLRRWGINLTEDAVALEAVRLGLSKTGKDLDDNAKTTARASLITKGLADAQGDLERTSGSTSNQLKKVGGTIVNLATDVGARFLPAVDTGLALLNEFGDFLGDVFTRNQGVFDTFVSGVQEAFNTVGVTFRNFGDVWEIARLAATEKINNLLAVFRSIGPNVVQIAGYIGRNWSKLIVDGINAGVTAFQNFAKNLADLGKAFVKWIKNPTKGFKFDWTPLAKGFEATAESLPGLIQPEFVSMEKEIDAVSKRIADKEAARAASMKKASAVAAPKAPPALAVAKKAIEAREKAQKKLEADSKKLFEDTRTPAEKLRIELEKLGKMRSAGLIDEDTLNRGRGIAKEEFEKESATKRAGALDTNSAEARSAVLAFRMQSRDDDPAKSTAQHTKTIAEKQTEAVAHLATLANRFNALVSRGVGAAVDAASDAFSF